MASASTGSAPKAKQVVSARAGSPPHVRAPSPVKEAPAVVGPAFAVGDRVTKEWSWPVDNPGNMSRSELIAKWMEATCLQCSVERNRSSEAVWDISCGTGFALDFEVHQLPSAGKLIVTATVSSVQQRQVTYSLAVVDDVGALIADGRHMRAYPTHGEMEAKMTIKLDRWRTLRPGLTGWYTSVVAKEHTGGSRDVAMLDGAVGDAASTSAVLTWMIQAAVSACDPAIAGQHDPAQREDRERLAGCNSWVSIPGRSAVSHLAPTPLGMTVLAKATLISVEHPSAQTFGRRTDARSGCDDEEKEWEGTVLTFALSAVDSSEEQVASGTHTRIVTRTSIHGDRYGAAESGPMTPSRRR
jgi:predicted thioesterase